MGEEAATGFGLMVFDNGVSMVFRREEREKKRVVVGTEFRRLVVGEKRKARATVYLDGVPAAGRSEKREEEGRPLAGNYGGGVATVRESEGE
ncbi:hypothetical protein HAX54_034001, partial [Datura stramonium]|nr:hypothetical protein [Datura stramonium]